MHGTGAEAWSYRTEALWVEHTDVTEIGCLARIMFRLARVMHSMLSDACTALEIMYLVAASSKKGHRRSCP